VSFRELRLDTQGRSEKLNESVARNQSRVVGNLPYLYLSYLGINMRHPGYGAHAALSRTKTAGVRREAYEVVL
jgi:hypothetical protein